MVLSAERTVRRATIGWAVVGVVVPTLVAVVGLLLVARWMGEVPDPVAVHWGPGGVPDAPGSPSVYMWILIGLAWLLPVLMSLSILPAIRGGKYQSTVRFLLATGVWLSVLMAVIAVGSMWVQRGLSSWTDAPDVGPILAIGFAASTALAVLSFLLLPAPTPEAGNEVECVAPLVLTPAESVAWSGSATTTGWILVPALMGSSLMVIVGIISTPTRLALGLPLLLTGLLLLVLVSMLGVFRVSVGRRGVVVRGLFGWPRVTVSLDDVAEAGVAEVSPVADWGGIGWRTRGGLAWGDAAPGVGVITRGGQALQVTKQDGSVLVVTSDDPTGAASTLLGLREQVHSEELI